MSTYTPDLVHCTYCQMNYYQTSAPHVCAGGVSGGICRSHGLAVLVTHVNDGEPCADYLTSTEHEPVARGGEGIERELEAVSVVDGLLVLISESPGWDSSITDHAFSYLRRMRRAYPSVPLSLSVCNELNRLAALNDQKGGEAVDQKGGEG